MPKKDTKLEKLSEMVYITVEEIKNLGISGLDQMFMEIHKGCGKGINFMADTAGC